MVYVISVLVKPYKSSVANVVEAMVLTDLLLLTALFLNTDRQEKAAIEPLSQLLLLLPFIAAGLYATLKIISMIWLVLNDMFSCVRRQCRFNYVHGLF